MVDRLINPKWLIYRVGLIKPLPQIMEGMSGDSMFLVTCGIRFALGFRGNHRHYCSNHQVLRATFTLSALCRFCKRRLKAFVEF